MNGSDADGGCPQECVQEASGIRRCDCIGTSREGTITGVLIDGAIPTIDTSQRGNWATQLFTVQGSTCLRVQVPEPCYTSRGGVVCTLLSCLADWS